MRDAASACTGTGLGQQRLASAPPSMFLLITYILASIGVNSGRSTPGSSCLLQNNSDEYTRCTDHTAEPRQRVMRTKRCGTTLMQTT